MSSGRATARAAASESRHSGGKARRAQERIEVTLDGLEQLLHRLDHQQMEPGDWPLVRGLVSQLIGRVRGRQERMLAKLAAAAAAAAAAAVEQKAGQTGVDEDASSDAGESADTSSCSGVDAMGNEEALSVTGGESETGKTAPDDSKRRKGHGRNGANAYRNAKHCSHSLAPGVIGALCESCERGKMSRYREKVSIHIVGQPLFGAEVHHYEQARCRNCGAIIRAQSPAYAREGLGTDYVRYDWSACGMLIVMHYFGGAPFKRLESLHQGWGVPMSDANQWELVSAADDRLLPLYRALEQHAIQKATNFRIDDTGSIVIALKRQIAEELAALEGVGESTKAVRTGINATGVYWETPDGPVILFYTGRHHAGEIVDQLLRHRLLASPKLVKCTDGASKNFDHEHTDKLVESTCNAHALLKFRDLKGQHPIEYAEAGRVYKQVFDNDDTAKDLGLGPVERMLYHRQHSKPRMLELKKMCEEKISSRLVEPSSPLWEPLTFVLNQWERLTRFYEEPGVPLDTNLVEQALIMPVRYLAGSFNYQTEDGALVGDHHMSLIASARANGVEPVAYLTECLRCHEDLARNPDRYLPWVYRERHKDEDDSPRGPPRRIPQLEPEPAALSA